MNTDVKEEVTVLNSTDIFETITDFPIPNFLFPDITRLLENHPKAFAKIVNLLYQPYLNNPPDYILCVESFGYVFGVPMALALQSKLALARKPGKLPRPTISRQYSMIYSNSKSLEIHREIIKPGSTFAIVDDFLASGGTSSAVADIILEGGGTIVGSSFVVELPSLNGRRILEEKGFPVNSIFHIALNDKKLEWEILNEVEGIYPYLS